jgi:serine/threonine protein kinase
MNTLATHTDPAVDALLGQLADEFIERLRRGERPSVDEYVNRYPHIAALLRRTLEAAAQLHRTPLSGSSCDATNDDPLLKEPLGDFQLIRKIGEGGMGIVYLAEQISLGRRNVAVKLLPSVSALDARMLRRFHNEAEAAASLKHEHIVPVYCIDCQRERHFYAMQYIEGLSLKAIIKKLRVRAGQEPIDADQTAPYVPAPGASGSATTDTEPLADLTAKSSVHSRKYYEIVAELGLQAAKGLDHAHQHYVEHRDIKPANLLVDGRDNLWITDFGLARIRNNSLTLPGELAGTLRYMSPEQAMAGRVGIDHRTDIYSLGATLYELLTLKPVFDGDERQEILRQVIFDDPKPPRWHDPDIPPDLETIVMAALAKSPAHRYSSAKEMAEDLQRFTNAEPIKRRPEGWPRWAWRKMRRHASALMLGLSVILTSVVLALLILHLNKPSPEAEAEKRQQQALAAHTHDLDLKKNVTLIGERGRPGYFRWASNANLGKILSVADGEFTVQNRDCGLVELLPDPRHERYRFRAEVRHEGESSQESRVGIYCAHSQHPYGETVAHCHCNLSFNDLVDVAEIPVKGNSAGNNVGLQAHCQFPMGVESYKNDFCPLNYFRPARPVGLWGPWRKLTVEVYRDDIKTSFKEKNANAITATVLRTSVEDYEQYIINKLNLTRPENQSLFPSRGGLGLYVAMGAASFRNVVIEPLGDDN